MPLDLISSLVSSAGNPEMLTILLTGMRRNLQWNLNTVIGIVTQVALTGNLDLFVSVATFLGGRWMANHFLFLAVVETGMVDMARWMVNNHRVTTSEGWVLLKAFESRNPEMLRFILDVRDKCPTGRRPMFLSPEQMLHDAISGDCGLAMAKFIVEELKADPCVPYTDGERMPLGIAAHINDVKILEYLMSFDGNVSRPTLMMALKCGVWSGNAEASVYLIDKLNATGAPFWHTRLALLEGIQDFCHCFGNDHDLKKFRDFSVLVFMAELNHKQVAYLKENHPCKAWKTYDQFVLVLDSFHGRRLEHADAKCDCYDPNVGLLVCEFL